MKLFSFKNVFTSTELFQVYKIGRTRAHILKLIGITF
jgi:hypothetical protein